jgi:hypothetical protein
MSNWKCNYQYAIDNVMDPMHGAYLHATSHSMAEGDKQADMRVRKTETGLMFEKVGQRDVNFDWVELGETGALWMRLAIPYKKKFGPGGNFGIIGFATPVDENNCQVYFWRTARCRAGSATHGASCIATVWKVCIGPCWNRTAMFSKAWRRMHASTNSSISTTSA